MTVCAKFFENTKDLRGSEEGVSGVAECTAISLDGTQRRYYVTPTRRTADTFLLLFRSAAAGI
jgi:hypothetical protein